MGRATAVQTARPRTALRLTAHHSQAAKVPSAAVRAARRDYGEGQVQLEVPDLFVKFS